MTPSTQRCTPPLPTSRPFGLTPSGQPVDLFTLTNAQGLQADITNYGGIMTRLLVPDRSGRLADVLLGCNTLDEYLAGTPYFGALIGRVGNRIAGARFTLDGRTCTLAANNAPGGHPCCLHGGEVGFDKVVWRASPAATRNGQELVLNYLSRDGEEGFPGNLDVTVRYALTDRNELRIEYRATTDRATPVNLTQHNYYNLRGEDGGEVGGHVLTLNASRMTPVTPGLIPTGATMPVAGTPFDFVDPKPIAAHIDDDHEQLRIGGGYDHNWIIDRTEPGLALAAIVQEPVSGRCMEVWTEEPAVQFYSANGLSPSTRGKTGKPYGPRHGFCLETQHSPDSPNQPGFPPIILRPGREYRTTTIHRFGTA